MGMCNPCKGDDHDHHRGKDYPERGIYRKGIKQETTHQIECTCPVCTQRPGWRGEPTTIPKNPMYRVAEPWIQPNPRLQKREEYQRNRYAIMRREFNARLRQEAPN